MAVVAVAQRTLVVLQILSLVAQIFGLQVLLPSMHQRSRLRFASFKMTGNSEMNSMSRYSPRSISQEVKSTGAVGLQKAISFVSAAAATTTLLGTIAGVQGAGAVDGKLEYMPALQGLDYGKPRTVYPDFVQKPSGLQYKMVKQGDGASPKAGDRAVVDWEGYTIGYYGRPFQTRNKVKGGAFDSTEKDYFRWVVGSGNAVAAIDEAVQYLKEGGVMQVIVPAELGYPASGDSDHEIVGPKPGTFSGQRALNFVLDNKNMIDKTLLINIRLVRVDPAKGLNKNS